VVRRLCEARTRPLALVHPGRGEQLVEDGVGHVTADLDRPDRIDAALDGARQHRRAERPAAAFTQLSLGGCDNSHLARLRSLWFTSVDGTSYNIGRQAADTPHLELAPRVRVEPAPDRGEFVVGRKPG